MASTEAPPIRVLLVDDHEIVRRGLAVFLDGYDDLELVGQAADGVEAVVLAHDLAPDVILMDCVMPKMDGPSAIRAIREQRPDAKIIALTTFRDKELVHSALQAGAIGYLYKDVSVDELADAIRGAHAGNTVMLSPQAAEALLDLIGASPPAEGELPVELTDRELKALMMVAEGLTNRQIAGAMQVSESTAKQYVRTIMAKLQVGSRTEAVAVAVQRNLLNQD